MLWTATAGTDRMLKVRGHAHAQLKFVRRQAQPGGYLVACLGQFLKGGGIRRMSKTVEKGMSGYAAWGIISHLKVGVGLPVCKFAAKHANSHQSSQLKT